MNKVDQILLLCKDEARLSYLANRFGWELGAMSTTLNALVEKGYLMKPRRGIYRTTNAGKAKAKANVKKEPDESKSIDRIVNRVSAQITMETDSTVDALRCERDSLRPPAKTETLRYVLRDIYIKSIGSAHRDKPDAIMSMWRIHEDPVCGDCKFDFVGAYENHLDYIKEYAGKRKLFRKLRWESFSDVEKYKHGFNLKTAFTKSDPSNMLKD